MIEKEAKIIEEFKSRVFSKLKQSEFTHYQTRTARLARNELELATSWSRAFSLIYTELKWLNALAQINRIAVVKTIHRMAKNYLQIQDNIIDKKLMMRAIALGPSFMPEK